MPRERSLWATCFFAPRRRFTQTHLQLKAVEPARKIPTLQDRRTANGENLAANEQLDDKIGPQGRILQGTNRQKSQKIPPVRMDEPDIPVSMPLIRTGASPQRLYQINEVPMGFLRRIGIRLVI